MFDRLVRDLRVGAAAVRWPTRTDVRELMDLYLIADSAERILFSDLMMDLFDYWQSEQRKRAEEAS